MERNEKIDLKKLQKAEVEKLTAALGGKAKIEWSRQFAASGKPRPARPIAR